MTLIGFDGIKKLLPQAYPFILVDRVEQFEKDHSIVCLKNVTGNEWMFPGHFPDKAIYPGVLLIEGLAQAGILLFELSREQNVITADEGDNPFSKANSTFLLAAVKSRLLKMVLPGDQLLYRCEAIKLMSHAGIVEGFVTVDGEIVAKAELTFSLS